MFRGLVLGGSLFFANALTVFCQFDSGSVLGTVSDVSQSPLPAASISLEEIRKGVKLNVRSSNSGAYEFLSIPIGRYKILVEQPGFRSQSSPEFEVTIGARQRVDFKLELESVQSSVQVTADVSVLQTDTSDRGQTIAAAQIRELPLAGRAYSELIYLSTGIVRTPSSGVGSAQREASFSVNGLRSTANNFLLDGLDNNYMGTSNQGFSNQVVQPPPDAVAEFRVITNNMSAEYGRAGGATVNASLRSGTNEFHGAAWEFFRNTQLNAVGFFKPLTGRPIQNQNQFGASGGGPIFRNRTFFFMDYEGYREVNSSIAFATLPNAAQRSGSLGVPIRILLRENSTRMVSSHKALSSPTPAACWPRSLQTPAPGRQTIISLFAESPISATKVILRPINTSLTECEASSASARAGSMCSIRARSVSVWQVATETAFRKCR